MNCNNLLALGNQYAEEEETALPDPLKVLKVGDEKAGKRDIF